MSDIFLLNGALNILLSLISLTSPTPETSPSPAYQVIPSLTPWSNMFRSTHHFKASETLSLCTLFLGGLPSLAIYFTAHITTRTYAFGAFAYNVSVPAVAFYRFWRFGEVAGGAWIAHAALGIEFARFLWKSRGGHEDFAHAQVDKALTSPDSLNEE